MKKGIFAFLLASTLLFGAAALDLQLKNGIFLPNVTFVRPALEGVTVTSTDYETGQTTLLTVPFEAISRPSLYSLRYYLMVRNTPDWDSPYLYPPQYSASIAALNSYLRGGSGRPFPFPVSAAPSMSIPLGPPGRTPTPMGNPRHLIISTPRLACFQSQGIYGGGSYGEARMASDSSLYGDLTVGGSHPVYLRGNFTPPGGSWIGRIYPSGSTVVIYGSPYRIYDTSEIATLTFQPTGY